MEDRSSSTASSLVLGRVTAQGVRVLPGLAPVSPWTFESVPLGFQGPLHLLEGCAKPTSTRAATSRDGDYLSHCAQLGGGSIQLYLNQQRAALRGLCPARGTFELAWMQALFRALDAAGLFGKAPSGIEELILKVQSHLRDLARARLPERGREQLLTHTDRLQPGLHTSRGCAHNMQCNKRAKCHRAMTIAHGHDIVHSRLQLDRSPGPRP